MFPEKGQHIKIFFRNGAVEEGIVHIWGEKQAVLKSMTTDNLLLIQDVEQDVMAIKIIIVSQQPQEKPKVYVEEDMELPEPERDINLRAMKLSELHRLRIANEKERARKAMTTFNNKGGNVTYGIPTRLQQPPDIDSAKKTR